MAEIEIQHDETEDQFINRMSKGDLHALIGKLTQDLISHGVQPETADHTARRLFLTLDALNGEGLAGTAMVLQALRNAHRKPWGTLLRSMPDMTPHDLFSCALHCQHEAQMALIAAAKHPDTPRAVVHQAGRAIRHIEENLRLLQEPFWATQAPAATDMEPAGNA